MTKLTDFIFDAKGYIDGSLSTIEALYISDTSLNASKFKWVDGLLEPSAAAMGDTTIIETSLYYISVLVDAINTSVGSGLGEYASNASVNLALFSNASLGLVGTATTTLSALTDVSIVDVAGNNLLQYDASFSLWMNVAPIDACSYFYTKSQIDASFALNSSVNLAFYSNVSLGTVSVLTFAHNASINALNASLNDTFLLSAYVNTSEYYDGSINDLRGQFYSNASLGLAVNIYANASLGTVSRLTFAHNTSIGLLNASLNDVLDAYGIFVPEVSVSHTYFKWTSEYLEPSGFTGTFLADGSLVTVTNGLIMSVDAV